MSINQIQVPNQLQKPIPETDSDKILKALQIVNGVFQIPVAYATFKEHMSAANANDQKAAQEERISKGILTPNEVETQKKEAYLLPSDLQKPDLLPNQQGPMQQYNRTSVGDLPATLPNKYEGLQPVSGNVITESGAQRPALIYSKEDISKQRENIASTTKNVHDVSAVANQAELNYQNISDNMEAAANGSQTAQKILLINSARLENPQMNRMSDQEVLDSLPEKLAKFGNYLTGKGGTKMLPSDVRDIGGSGKLALENVYGQLGKELTPYSKQAESLGVPPETIGIRNREVTDVPQIVDKKQAAIDELKKRGKWPIK